MLRQLRQTDSINGCNSLSAELMFRRLQTVEYSRAERARDAESKAMGLSSKLALEEQFVFGSLVKDGWDFHGVPYIAAACKGGDRKRSPVGQKPLQGQGGEGARSTLAGRRSISLEATGGMPVLGGRATLHAIKHVLGRQSGFSKRHLVLSDYMSAIGAIGKGRGKTFGLRHVTQQIGALLLGSGSSVNLRWIPSEMNPADGPSRGSLFPSKYSGCLGVMVLRRLIVVGTPAKKTQKNAKQGKPSAPSTRSRQNRRPLGHVKVGQPKSKRYQKGGRLQLMPSPTAKGDTQRSHGRLSQKRGNPAQPACESDAAFTSFSLSRDFFRVRPPGAWHWSVQFDLRSFVGHYIRPGVRPSAAF